MIQRRLYFGSIRNLEGVFRNIKAFIMGFQGVRLRSDHISVFGIDLAKENTHKYFFIADSLAHGRRILFITTGHVHCRHERFLFLFTTVSLLINVDFP